MYITLRFNKFTDWISFDKSEDEILFVTGKDLDTDENKSNIAWVQDDCYINDVKFYCCYNKDATCNANTRQYCLSKPIDFNDFHCKKVVMNDQRDFNYSFTINSSIGPYVRFIIYRAYDSDGELLEMNKDTQTRWYLNDFIVNADYEKMTYYDGYNQVYPFVKGSWYDYYLDSDFKTKYFDILNFGSYNLVDQNSRSGRPLASDTKIGYEISSSSFVKKDGETVAKSITHCFYIITGRMVTINNSGLVNIV